MRIFKPILPILLVFISACSSSQKTKPAHFRMISMIPDGSGELTIRGKGKNQGIQKRLTPGYADSASYQELTPGHYEVSLKAKGKDVLKGSFVMGSGGYYTMVAMGLLPKNWSVNPQSTVYKLKYILAGSELVDANQYLPQWFMMRDNYDGSEKQAYIRFVNANPYTPTITVRDDKKALKSGLAYPKETDKQKLKPGQHHLRFMYGDIELARKTVGIKPGYIYSVIIGSNRKTKEELTISVLANPSRALLRSK